jgi:hypothetical protein
MEVFKNMLHELAVGRKNPDGADQGFLTGYFPDLLDQPMFHPPVNGTKLDGNYRLPLGYQMDASYYCEYDYRCISILYAYISILYAYALSRLRLMNYTFSDLKLRWSIPCGPNSVVTFPSAPWMKPWYWWSWPVLPLGLSWHEQRREHLGWVVSLEKNFIHISVTFSNSLTLTVLRKKLFEKKVSYMKSLKKRDAQESALSCLRFLLR